MTISEILRHLRGLLVVLTSPLWFPIAVLVRGVLYNRYSFCRCFQDFRRQLSYAWSDLALSLRIRFSIYVAWPLYDAGQFLLDLIKDKRS